MARAGRGRPTPPILPPGRSSPGGLSAQERVVVTVVVLFLV